MPHTSIPIAPLTKVTLALRATTTGTRLSEESPPADFIFVYGIGTEGLTGFEQAILGKNSGDRLMLPMDSNHASSHLEHLLTPLMQTLQIHPPFDLHIEIKSVSPATDRELVQALSQKVDGSGCGCDGGCGCGC